MKLFNKHIKLINLSLAIISILAKIFNIDTINRTLFTSRVKTYNRISLSEILNLTIIEDNYIDEETSKIEESNSDSESDLNSGDIENKNKDENDIYNYDTNTSDLNQKNYEDNNLFVIFKNNKNFSFNFEKFFNKVNLSKINQLFGEELKQNNNKNKDI